MLPAQPLELVDFSGGITENVLQGDPRRYQNADNLFITVDKKLRQRGGFVIDSDTTYQITGKTGQRINGYHQLNYGPQLISQISRDLYYKNDTPAWTKIAGIDGRQALSGGDAYSQTTFGEFQKITYLATDSALGENGFLGSKIFKDDTNSWVARTVGLPRAYVSGTYTDESLLAKCIVNANLIRASMVSHFQNAENALYIAPTAYQTSTTSLHINIDRYSLSYFQSVTFGADPYIPNPIPTPLAACTSEATLLALVGALNTAYAYHIADGMVNSWGTHPETTTAVAISHPIYHQDPPVYSYTLTSPTGVPLQKTKGPGAPLALPGTPDSVEEAAGMLDDLWQKWTWHRLAVNTHNKDNSYAFMNLYALDGEKVGDVKIGNSFPLITPNWGDVVGYVNNLRDLYNNHVTNLPGVNGVNIAHIQRDNNLYDMQLECTLPESTDLDSSYLLIWWLRSLYQLHYYDASLDYWDLTTFSSSIGSANITAVSNFPATNLFMTVTPLSSPLVSMSAITNTQQFATPTYRTAKVTNTGVTTATLDHTVSATQVGVDGVLSTSMYHMAFGGSPLAPITSNDSLEVPSDTFGSDVTTYGTNLSSWLALANDLFFAMSNHMMNATLHVTAVLGGDTQASDTYQYLIDTIAYPNFQVPTTGTASYALFFSHDYTVEKNGIEYLVQGNPVLSDSLDVAISYSTFQVPPNPYANYYAAKPELSTRGNLLSNLPVLVNSSATSYDVTNIKLNIYKTLDGGQTYYLVTQVDNGTTEFLDVSNDTLPSDGDVALSDRETIYTSGGVVGFDQPPIAKFVHILDGTAYWGGITDAGQYFPNRVRQSIKGAPDAAPANFFDDLDSPITGISSSRTSPIVFCDPGIYRLSGSFNSQGQGFIAHENIAETLSCLNAKGIIQTEVGVFFPGTDGFYYTDGYQVIPLANELRLTYQRLTATDSQKRLIYGAYDTVERRVWGAMCEEENGTENTVIYGFYLNYGIKPSGTFTLMRNQTTVKPSAIAFLRGEMFMAHELGYFLKLDSDIKGDVKVDTAVTPTSWQKMAVPYNLLLMALDMGTSFMRKWVTKIHVVGQNHGDISAQPLVIRDLDQYGQGARELAPINYIGNCRWGDPLFAWGDEDFQWGVRGKMDLFRRVPSRVLRSDVIQFQFKPRYGVVYASSSWPIEAWATINSTTKVITLRTPSEYTSLVWPVDVVDYYISFETDAYETEYLVTAVSTNTLTVSDAANALTTVPSPGVQWQISGYKKEQRFSLSSLDIHFAYLGNENQAYPGPNTNSGPGNAGGNP